MFKKITAVVVSAGLFFSGFSLTGLGSSLENACSYVCCDHDGDMWDN